MSVVGTVFSTAMILLGIVLYFYPNVSEWLLERETNEYISDFQAEYEDYTEEDAEAERNLAEELGGVGKLELSSNSDTPSRELYRTIMQYNYDIFVSRQSGLVDAWSYEQAPISLSGLSGDKFGYISIPAMDITYPIYVGASTKNMARGVAVMGQTSLPIGGENTNCVIVGHRGYQGIPYFREIEKLSLGDYVYITNPWEDLAYKVTAIDIITPSDSKSIKIQEGKDMVTLVTCHPYRSHGKYRYVVYCERTELPDDLTTAHDDSADATENTLITTGEASAILASDGNLYASSEDDIAQEDAFRKLIALLILAMVGGTYLIRFVRWRRRKVCERREDR
jgi:sortase A